MKTTNSVFANITFVNGQNISNPKFKPNLEKLINTPEAVFTIELFKSTGVWFRIIRLLNQRRTHDFIIGELKDNTLYVENGNSQYCMVQLKDHNDLIEMFKNTKIYSKYTRPKDTTYVHDESTLINIEDLIKEWNSLK